MNTFTGLKSLVRLRVETEKKFIIICNMVVIFQLHKYETSPILDQFWLNKSKRQI